MRILVIEDDKKAAQLLATGLREEGLVVDIASTGAAGDEMASMNTYAVIVLDRLLPDREGIVVCRDLRRRADGSRCAGGSGDRARRGRRRLLHRLDWGERS